MHACLAYISPTLHLSRGEVKYDGMSSPRKSLTRDGSFRPFRARPYTLELEALSPLVHSC